MLCAQEVFQDIFELKPALMEMFMILVFLIMILIQAILSISINIQWKNMI